MKKIWKTTTYSTEMQCLASQDSLSVLQNMEQKISKSDLELFRIFLSLYGRRKIHIYQWQELKQQ